MKYWWRVDEYKIKKTRKQPSKALLRGQPERDTVGWQKKKKKVGGLFRGAI